MLAEAVVSGTVIIISMIVLYSTFNKLYTMYSEKNNYYNIDAIYATKEMTNYLMNREYNNENPENENFESIINKIFKNSTHFILIGNNMSTTDNNSICRFRNKSPKGEQITINVLNENSVCKNLKNTYKINNMIITEYDKSTLESLLKQENLNKYLNGNPQLKLTQTFKDYIKYVINYYGVSNHDTKYEYIVLTEIKDGDNYYYANLGIG